MSAPTAPKHTCELCYQDFTKRYNLLRHMERIHNTNNRENFTKKGDLFTKKGDRITKKGDRTVCERVTVNDLF